MKTFRIFAALTLVILVSQTSLTQGQDAKPQSRIDMVERAVDFLEARQNPDGSFSSETGPAITSIIVTGMLRNGIPESHPVVKKSLEYLKSFVQKTGDQHASAGDDPSADAGGERSVLGAELPGKDPGAGVPGPDAADHGCPVTGGDQIIP